MSYSPDSVTESLKLRDKRKRFKELLCNEKYGLCVYIVKESCVVLRPDNVDLEYFMMDMIQECCEDSGEEERVHVDKENASCLLKGMDTE